MNLRERVRDAVIAAGASGFGVAAADPFPSVRRDLEDRAAAGLSGRLGFTFTDPAVSTDVCRTFPWARRLAVAAWTYLPAAGGPGPAAAGTGRIARFAAADHYEGLRTALGAGAAVLGDAGYRAEILIDDNRLVDRAAAVRAGVGWWGKNTMILAPGSGPWLLLGSLVTDAPLPVSTPMVRDCGTCEACLPACPTGALVAPGVLDARRCLAALAQAPGVIPRSLRAAMGDRVYGCDDCLEACPPGDRIGREVPAAGRIDLAALLGTDDRGLLAAYGHFYLPRRDPRYLRRNALVALGNAGGPDAVAIAAGYLGHPDWLLRLHAAWALGRRNGPIARAALAARQGGERNDEVRSEIDLALAAGR